MREREFWAEVERGRRLAAPHAGSWRARVDEVLDEDGRLVARCRAAWVAELVAVMHNLWLPVTNVVLMQSKKRGDRETMRND